MPDNNDEMRENKKKTTVRFNAKTLDNVRRAAAIIDRSASYIQDKGANDLAVQIITEQKELEESEASKLSEQKKE